MGRSEDAMKILEKRTVCRIILGLSAALTTGACVEAPGGLRLTTWGEAFIEQGIPAAGGPDEEGFVDGHAMRYDTFLVVLGELRVEDAEGDVAAERAESRVFDLTRPGPHAVVRLEDVPAGRWSGISARIAPDPAAVAGNATPAQLEEVRTRGASVIARGTLTTTSGAALRFDWAFDTATRYEDCTDADGDPGVVVPSGGVVEAQLTVHGDHLFYDDLQSPEARLRGWAIAGADADRDGVVELQELARVGIDGLTGYGTGGDGEVDELGAFVRALTRTLVHFQGEGHCRARRL
jgi:hypothetical protein